MVNSRLPSQPGYGKKVKIEYMYVIGNVQYVSDRISPGGDLNYGVIVLNKDLMNKCSINSECEVFYDPEKPELSAIKIGIQFSTILMFCGGVLLLFLSGQRGRITKG